MSTITELGLGPNAVEEAYETRLRVLHPLIDTSEFDPRPWDERGEGDRIVNTSSTAGFVASPGLGHYTAAKHGVIDLTKTLAVELAPHGISTRSVRLQSTRR
ncbi:SDR family NAD(P)-dependent oxidoreductase [Natrinema salifodinae]|uniref:SDR family NAD(P)-dependent oxidoreductase n=1 Tax=Natrinema salifodinae TaxID=1202768 RepID=UPI0006799B32|nr:SDR family NAD(P)-dependent oxidoreductase [Natrinema salifodinae]